MRTIELQTTQNVTINYELAQLRDRVLAFLIDMVVLAAAVLFLLVVFFNWVLEFDLEVEFAMLVISPLISFYTLAFESLNNGRTIGKMALRIKVVRIDGKPMRFSDYLLRWTFRLIDVWFSGGAVAVVMVSSSPNAQRLGGLVSNSTVVKARPGLFVTLADLERIDSTVNHTPVYPDVRHFREQDMLTIKHTIERYHRYRNEAHREALDLVTLRVCEQLRISDIPSDKVKFLKDLIKDYIVLTR